MVVVRMRMGVRVRMRVRDVVVGENRVGIGPLWVTPWHVIGLLLKAKQRGSVSIFIIKYTFKVILI